MIVPKVFLMGAGGMGIAPLAMYLAANGYESEAFDDFLGNRYSQLENAGVSIINEPYPLNKPVIVRSSAIQASDSRLLTFRLRI